MHVTGNYLMLKPEVELSGLCFCGLGLLATHCTLQAVLKFLVAITPQLRKATWVSWDPQQMKSTSWSVTVVKTNELYPSGDEVIQTQKHAPVPSSIRSQMVSFTEKENAVYLQ